MKNHVTKINDPTSRTSEREDLINNDNSLTGVINKDSNVKHNSFDNIENRTVQISESQELENESEWNKIHVIQNEIKTILSKAQVSSSKS